MASLVSQMVKHLPATWETQVQSLGREESLEKEMATHSSILAWKISMDWGAWKATVHRVTKSWTRLSNFTSLSCLFVNVSLGHQLICQVVFLLNPSINEARKIRSALGVEKANFWIKKLSVYDVHWFVSFLLQNSVSSEETDDNKQNVSFHFDSDVCLP